MPTKTWIERRDCAILAYLLLMGVRNSALLSLRIKDNDLEHKNVHEKPNWVHTKNSKFMTTTWFPLGGDIEIIVTERIKEISNLTGSDEGPLFPRAQDLILVREMPDYIQPLLDPGTVRRILKRITAEHQLPSFSPHKFRHILAVYGVEICNSVSELTSWSVNLGHESLTTMLKYHAKPSPLMQEENMRQISAQSFDSLIGGTKRSLSTLLPDINT